MSPALSPFNLLQGAEQAQAPSVHGAVDSVRMDQSPLPGGVASVFRFLFSGVPQWIQIGGVVLGVLVGLVVVVLAWRHRAAIAAWLASRTRGYRLALGAGIAVVLVSAGLVGGWTYHYMMHENDFCSSCHVMKSAFGKFQTSEHSKLQCHNCHQQSIFASSKELYFWVMERPDKIPPHSKVPNRICAECHITEKRDSVWQFVSATAGHQVHMRSDSTVLRDVMCVTCHARQVHAFAPVDVSCKDSGCHEKIKVRLGKMADQTSLHCTTCHNFARPVNAQAPLDSGRAGLVPLKPQCFTCHEMREKLRGEGLDRDPHKAACGTCHNPHTQEQAAGAIKSCATAECHANADTLTAFHRGLPNHALDKCTSCHKAHTWKVESTNCITCHEGIFKDRPRSASIGARANDARSLGARSNDARTNGARSDDARTNGARSNDARTIGTPPNDAVPSAWNVPHQGRRGGGGPSDRETTEAPLGEEGEGGVTPTSVATPTYAMQSQDTIPRAKQTRSAWQPGTPFPHSRHRSVGCTNCHSSSATHGAVMVRAPADCQSCHHGATQRAKCESCHASTQLAAAIPVPVTIRISAGDKERQRTLSFAHARHGSLACTTCHGSDVSRAPTKTCESCHADHHAIARDCTACHPTPREGHGRDTHEGCATCHTDAAVKALPPTRPVCLACHQQQREHFVGQECVSCHALAWNAAARHGARP